MTNINERAALTQRVRKLEQQVAELLVVRHYAAGRDDLDVLPMCETYERVETVRVSFVLSDVNCIACIVRFFTAAGRAEDPRPSEKPAPPVRAESAPGADEPEYELGKLRGALVLAQRSRDLWRDRALAAGWTQDSRGPDPAP